MEETRAGGGGGAAGGDQDAALARASEEKATLLDMVTTNPYQLLLVTIKSHVTIKSQRGKSRSLTWLLPTRINFC